MKSNSQVRKMREGYNKFSSWGNLVKERLDIIIQSKGKKILDVGCSKGSYVKALTDLGYDSYGCDIFEHEEWKGEYNSRFKIGDINNLPYADKSFDTVFAFEVVEHIKNPQNAIKELKRVSKKNVIISVPNCNVEEVLQRSGLTYHHFVDRTHVNFFTKDSLIKLMNDNNLKVDIVKYINPIIAEMVCLYLWRFPLNVIYLLGRYMNKLPFRRKLFMTLLIKATI